MKRTPNSRGWAGAAAMAAALIWVSALAADKPYESARQATKAAQELQAKGQWEEAQILLERAAQNCGPQDTAQACRLLVRYSQGYLSEREAGRTPEKAVALLAAAEERYLAVLAEAPQHEATLKNLALIYRELGRQDDAERLLQRAVEADRSGTGRATMLLAQLYRDAGKFDAALAGYERAAAANPGDAAAPQAIVALYATGPSESLGALLPRLANWAPTLPAVAEEGYRRILMRVPSTPQAEQALLPWVSLIARQGWVAASTFAGLPKGWAPLDEVIRYAATPELQPSSGGWWMQHAMRRSILAQLALATGQAPEARAEPARALRRFEVGMMVSPQYEEYQQRSELKGAWPTRMEIARAMLSLLSRQPQLDPNSQQQRHLINELFAGKAGAYRSEDLVAMQRFHTTLGRWYVERGEWSGGGLTNAKFQLEHAIDAADLRTTRGEAYQPLQEEKELLAAGYLKLGEPAKARSMYLQAAAAYLDTDQLQPAHDALALSERIASAPTSANIAQATLLRQVLATRVSLAEKPAPAGFERQPQQSWLRGDIAQPFLKRQQFKTLSDLALQTPDAGQDNAAAMRAGAAFQSALDLRSLIGTADLVRLERVKTLATARADVADRRTPVVATRPALETGGMAWSLYVPAENRSLYIKIGADAVLAGRVDAALQGYPALADKELRFSVDGGAVKVFVPPGGAATPIAEEQLKRVEGVRSVTMMIKQ